jgi:hypothetical protein
VADLTVGLEWTGRALEFSGGYDIERVFIDEPATGTWAWACERLLVGNVRRRSFPDENYVTLKAGKLTWGDFTDFVPYFEDLTATNWEIAS